MTNSSDLKLALMACGGMPFERGPECLLELIGRISERVARKVAEETPLPSRAVADVPPVCLDDTQFSWDECAKCIATYANRRAAEAVQRRDVETETRLRECLASEYERGKREGAEKARKQAYVDAAAIAADCVASRSYIVDQLRAKAAKS